MKTLTRVRLINWHRFENETIDFSGSVLLSGENGAGKSTILDAIQFVITCSKANFNKAAHEKGARTLNSYIRCKTGREDRPYERQGSISSHIALEFSDDEKGYPFIVGAVMDSASEESEPNVNWYLMERCELGDDLFFTGRQVKSVSQFRSTNKGIRQTARTATEARAMMLSRFGRLDDKFFSLIPKALAFKPIHDIKEFVYSYVLDAKVLNIDALRQNVRSYQELERMLEDVRARIGELENIITRKEEVDNYLRIDCRHEYYLARVEQDLIAQEIESAKADKRQAAGRVRHYEHEKKRLARLRDGKEQTIRQLSAELASDSEYQTLMELSKRQAALEEAIETDNDAVRQLYSAASDAADRAEALLGDIPAEDAEKIMLRDYIKALRGLESMLDLTLIHVVVQTVMEYKSEHYRLTSDSLAETRIRLTEKENSLRELNGRIRQLEERKLDYRPEVLLLESKIREQLRSLGRSGDVRILCEQLEIVREPWRNAVEGYLNTQRFYLITEPEDFEIALSVYDQLRSRRMAYGVGLINTAKLAEYDEAPAGSLAECVSSANIWARRYANMVLGKVHCCDSYEDLKNHATAITRHCMKYQNHVASAIRPEIYNKPYIGSGAYKVQLEQALRDREALETEIKGLKDEAARLERLSDHLGQTEDIDVRYRLRDLESLREHEAQLTDCRDEIRTLKASKTMMHKQLRLDALESEKRVLDSQIEDAAKSLGAAEEKVRSATERIEAAEWRISEQEDTVRTLRAGLGDDAEECDKEYLRQTEDREYARYRQNYESARKGNTTRREKAVNLMAESMQVYNSKHDFGAAPTLDGYTEFYAEYEKLRNSRLLEYQDKVERARAAAEAEFREQFLARLQENIKQAQNEFRELNKALRDIRFSGEQYEFRFEARKSLKKFYDMIMDDFNVLGGGTLFSGTFSAAHREAIDELFERLALDDNTSDKVLQEYTDYRTYMDYDIKITLGDGSYMYYSKVSREKSGGETQTPFYITIAASFMQLYRASIGGDSIGLVMMDEAFNNMDDSRMSGVLSFMSRSNLQTIIAAPPEKIQYIASEVDRVLLVLTDGELSYVENFEHSEAV